MQVVICSKSLWTPRIRREHAIAESAAADGHDVVFVERARDVRGGRSGGGDPVAGVRVLSQRTLLPGHLNALAERLDAARLTRTLRRVAGIEESVVVATQPWQWPAIAAAPALRRVFDCADDWRRLIPRRAGAISALYGRIGAEADAVILVSPALAPEFGRREVAVVGNGVSRALRDAPAGAESSEPLMVYAGTLSERFDAPFVRAVLERLPEWSVELVGECQYARGGDAPGPELRALLSAGRASWRGPVERRELAAALDRARVLIAPHRPGFSEGQDSMKLYDYAARERRVVCTPGALGAVGGVPGVVEAATPEEFAAAVAGGSALAVDRTEWLERHAWEARWREWARAALGQDASRAVGEGAPALGEDLS